MAGREPAADLPYVRYCSPVRPGLVGAWVCLSDPPASKLPGSLCAHHVGGGSEAPEGVAAMIRDLFSPTLPVEFRDLQAIGLLTCLADDPSINRTVRAAALHAVDRLWEGIGVSLDDDDEPDGPEGDDGPLSLGSPGEDGVPLEPSLSSLGPSSIRSPSSVPKPDLMFR